MVETMSATSVPNCSTTNPFRSRPGPPGSESAPFSTVTGRNRDNTKAGYAPAARQITSHARPDHCAECRIVQVVESDLPLQEAVESGKYQLHGDHRDAESDPDVEEALAQKLYDDLPSGRAHSLAHAHLDRAACGTSGHHADEVASRDEEDQEPDDEEGIHGASVGRRLHILHAGRKEMKVWQGTSSGRRLSRPARCRPSSGHVAGRSLPSGRSACVRPRRDEAARSMCANSGGNGRVVRPTRARRS